MRPVLVLRPEPGATATAAAARVIGLDAVIAPLFALHPTIWSPPVARPDALLLTSANAARLGGAGLDPMLELPVYAVGAATAAAAAARGFRTVVTGDADAETILSRARADGAKALLHLAGREHRAARHAALRIARRIVYAADAVARLPSDAARALPHAVALLHSPRAAALFASLLRLRTGVAVAVISPAALAAAGSGWRAVAVAAQPSDGALLAAAAGLCDQ